MGPLSGWQPYTVRGRQRHPRADVFSKEKLASANVPNTLGTMLLSNTCATRTPCSRRKP